MSDSGHLKVVLCWHMHQPQYRDLISTAYHQPWTYLHTIKDYVDMAAHLESAPSARVVVNFAPILLEQIDDYARQVNGYLTNSMPIHDHLLATLVGPVMPSGIEHRISLVKALLQVNEQHGINRFPAYRRLADLAALFIKNPETMTYVDDQFLVDLLVWYHLAWMGETVRRREGRVKELIAKECKYTLHDRRVLLEVIGELLSGVIGRYKSLAESGRVELSMSPYAHPILPLLVDINCARDAIPNMPLPNLTQYPGGTERSRWHLVEGIRTFQQYFGFKPKGCWPPEGGMSTATISLLGEYGFKWAASGENVFRNSIAKKYRQGERTEYSLYFPYRVAGSSTACFFRNDGLSDLIGFTYSNWHADDAVANLVHHLENIANANASRPGSVVSIILDGENAWEHYPENGYYFLSALYESLVNHPRLELTTFSDYLEKEQAHVGELPALVSGSWVYGTFSTWIGGTDKNRGWEMLGDAKQTFDRLIASDRLTNEQLIRAQQQLAICEGSDWFWWFGDYNPAATVSDFEQLYRQHLTNLYQMLTEEPPEYLSHVFTRGKGAPKVGGVMRTGLQT
jgi:alpha-amylase/alpha-mannosidase (GH57 family)